MEFSRDAAYWSFSSTRRLAARAPGQVTVQIDAVG
jgi:hypothetical protein